MRGANDGHWHRRANVLLRGDWRTERAGFPSSADSSAVRTLAWRPAPRAIEHGWNRGTARDPCRPQRLPQRRGREQLGEHQRHREHVGGGCRRARVLLLLGGDGYHTAPDTCGGDHVAVAIHATRPKSATVRSQVFASRTLGSSFTRQAPRSCSSCAFHVTPGPNPSVRAASTKRPARRCPGASSMSVGASSHAREAARKALVAARCERQPTRDIASVRRERATPPMPPAARAMDRHACPHRGGSLMRPSQESVIICGKPAARAGDPAFCDAPRDVITTGEPSVLIAGKNGCAQGRPYGARRRHHGGSALRAHREKFGLRLNARRREGPCGLHQGSPDDRAPGGTPRRAREAQRRAGRA